MELGPNLFIFKFGSFCEENTRFMTLSVETVRMEKSQPSKNRLERSDLLQEYPAIQ